MHSSNRSAASYSTASDFINTFAEELDSLYLLSLLLSADKRKAEQCSVCAMGECVEGTGVFTGWASPWTRQAVLKSAIRMVMLYQSVRIACHCSVSTSCNGSREWP